MPRPRLRIVDGKPVRQFDPEDMLAEIVPELIAAEQTVAALRGQLDNWRRKLAEKRRVAFIHEEQVRSEFGQ